MNRRLVSLLSGLILCITLLLGSGGCASATPPKTPPSDPVSVFVTDYGIHSSLILPLRADDGVYIEYAFGDFGYAALNRDGPLDALGALFCSIGSGIGRQYLRTPINGDVPILIYEPKTMVRIQASQAKVNELLQELEYRFNNAKGPVVHNELTKINWRKDHPHYSAFNNCNQLTARQLKVLGYTVRGWVLFPMDIKGEPVNPQAWKDPSKDAGGLSGSR